MRKALIVALVCLNVVLVAALLAVNVRRAEAQHLRGGNDFIMITGRIESTFDAVYVIDLKTRRLAGWRWDRTAKKLLPYKGRTLTQDFR